MIGPLPATQRGTVLAGVNAKPCGWPAANVDSGCGRHPQTAAGTRLEEWARDQDPPIRGLHAFGGLPHDQQKRLCASPWCAVTARKVWASMANVMWRCQAVQVRTW